MPWMQEELRWPAQGPEGFCVSLGETEFVRTERLAHFRLHRQNYVLKRSFIGADTRIGVVTPGRQWNNVLDMAVSTKEYLIQRYRSLPRTTMPVSTDGKTIHWIPVRVELSPFIIFGRYAGAIARYAPESEGLRLSPPPEGMGMTIVYDV